MREFFETAHPSSLPQKNNGAYFIPFHFSLAEFIDISTLFFFVFTKLKYSRLSHDVVTCDVDRDVSTAY